MDVVTPTPTAPSPRTATPGMSFADWQSQQQQRTSSDTAFGKWQEQQKDRKPSQARQDFIEFQRKRKMDEIMGKPESEAAKKFREFQEGQGTASYGGKGYRQTPRDLERIRGQQTIPSTAGGTDLGRTTEHLDRTIQETTNKSLASNDHLNKALVDLAEKLGNVNISIPDVVQHQINGSVEVNLLGNHALTQAIAQEIKQLINTQVNNAMANQVSPLSGETLVG
jgi:hypothetical protein